MPAGPEPMGFAYFAAAKFLGYSAYCGFALQRKEESLAPDKRQISPWIAGAIRTVIGLAVGAVVGLGFWKIPFFDRHDTLAESLFFVLLIPVRVGEWWVLMRIFYKELLQHRKLAAIMIIGGILVSFGLDVLGIFAAFVMPGGMWVC